MRDGMTEAEGRELVECYESLREDGLSGSGRTLHGRALLMFKGMAAWMHNVCKAPALGTAPAAPKSQLRLPVGLEQNLINIIAAMTLATAKECRP